MDKLLESINFNINHLININNCLLFTGYIQLSVFVNWTIVLIHNMHKILCPLFLYWYIFYFSINASYFQKLETLLMFLRLIGISSFKRNIHVLSIDLQHRGTTSLLHHPIVLLILFDDFRACLRWSMKVSFSLLALNKWWIKCFPNIFNCLIFLIGRVSLRAHVFINKPIFWVMKSLIYHERVHLIFISI